MDPISTFVSGLFPGGSALAFLLDLTLKSACVIPVAFVVAAMLKRSSASLRHLVWLMSLLTLLAAPVVSRFVAIDRSEAEVGHADQTTVDSRRHVLPDHEPVPAAQVEVQPQAMHELTVPTKQLVEQPPDAAPDTPTAVMTSDTSFVREDRHTGSAEGRWWSQFTLRQWELLAAGLWLVGILVLGWRVLAGQVALHRTLKAARPANDPGIQQAAVAASRATSLQRNVTLLLDDQSSMPMTCGVFRAVILLPASATRWSPERLRFVLMHEMAHVRRLDCLWKWLTFLVTALYWFNPLVWLATARLRAEHEQACDDRVLNAGVKASDYAETLLAISTANYRNVVRLCSEIAMARSHRLAARVEAIVDERRNRRPLTRPCCLVTALAALVLTVPLTVFARAELEVLSPPVETDVDTAETETKALAPAQQPERGKQKQQRVRQQTPEPDKVGVSREHVSVTLPGGIMLRASEDYDALVAAALALLDSTSVEIPYQGQQETSVTILFSPRRSIPFSFGNPGDGKPESVGIGRLYVDTGNVFGPDSIVAEIDGKYRSFSKHQIREWVAFRREFDRIRFGRPRPIVPATGEWSKPVNGVQARLSVENWRDPMIAVFLELKNNKNLVNTITVPIQAEKIQFESRGPDGKLIPDAGLPRSGPVVVLQDFRLPFESTLRFNLSVSTVGVPGNAAAMIPLRSHAWVISANQPGPCRLGASIRVERKRGQKQTVWHGRLQIPPVTVRLSAEERRPDREISWKYQVSPAARNSRLETLNALFEGESDVTCRTSTRPNEIEVTASQSRQLFVRDLVDALENGSSTQAADSKRAWLRRYPFRNNQFTFVRVKYSSGDGRPRRGARWATDYPDAERGLSARLAGWTSLDVDPDGRVLELTDPELPRYPFLYMAEPGALVLDDQEVVALRKYLTSGGFLMADDFWGEAEWRNLRTQLKRVLPDVEPIDLPLTHRLFHCVFDFREKPQVCSIAVALHGRARGVTWEREDGREPHYYGLIDRTSGRMMAVLCHNTDLGDGWERRDESAWYAEEFSEKRAYPMALNIIFHAMTQ